MKGQMYCLKCCWGQNEDWHSNFRFGNGQVIVDQVKGCFSTETITQLELVQEKKSDIQGNNVTMEQMKRVRISNSWEVFQWSQRNKAVARGRHGVKRGPINIIICMLIEIISLKNKNITWMRALSERGRIQYVSGSLINGTRMKIKHMNTQKDGVVGLVVDPCRCRLSIWLIFLQNKYVSHQFKVRM